jgi:hypothetical protein
MTTPLRTALKQRADYTHKPNIKSGRHGWLRLTPAYSVKIVEELMGRYDRPMRILDPFSGTATTALSAAYHGHQGVTADINPFLVWFGQAKTAYYSPKCIVETRQACARLLESVRTRTVKPMIAPPIHNINRWWEPGALDFLCLLLAGIESITKPGSGERTLLSIAFCRSLIRLSNASFNHQSMSFKNVEQLGFFLDTDMPDIFLQDVSFVLDGAADNPQGAADVFLGDARDIAATVQNGSIEGVITSPPYANRMSYIRELRPYMYWLGYLTSGREAGEFDWSAIGGTWGIATSRLVEWKRPAERFESELLQPVLKKISQDLNQSGRILANYVARYFDDMWRHFQSLVPVLAPNAEIHYVVGNSTFYGVLLPVEQLYATMLDRLGFVDIECRPIRKRNSKKELIEFDVSATWPS